MSMVFDVTMSQVDRLNDRPTLPGSAAMSDSALANRVVVMLPIRLRRSATSMKRAGSICPINPLFHRASASTPRTPPVSRQMNVVRAANSKQTAPVKAG